MSLVNQPVSDTLTLQDGGGSPVLGATAAAFSTLSARQIPTGPTAAVALAELGGGLYAVTFTPTTVGTWSLSAVLTGPPVRSFGATYQVEATPGVAVASTAITASDLGLRLMQGDDYLAADGRHRVWALGGAPNLAGATVTLTVGRNGRTVFAASGSVAGAHPGTQTVSVPLTRAQTELLGSTTYDYQLKAVLAVSGNVVTLATDRVVAEKRVGA